MLTAVTDQVTVND